MAASTVNPGRTTALLAALGLWAAVTVGQQPAPAPPAPVSTPAAAAPKLASWPPLGDSDKQRALALCGQFKKEDAALREGAADQLVQLGTGVAPLLFLQVSDRVDNAAVNVELFAVFDRLLQPQHAALMARECKKNKLALRQYLLQRLCRFHDPDLEPVLQAATKDQDEQNAFYAHLGLLGLGRAAALPPVLDRCRRDWLSVQPLVAEVLPHARSDALGLAVAEAIAKATTPLQAAGLRLMRYLATENQLVIVRTYLGAEDHNVKKEAVNAMRALHGMAPIEDLPVFKAIEMAKEWLSK